MRKVCALILVVALAGCGESMDRQNRLKTYGEAHGLAPGWPGQGEALVPPAGTVSQRAAARDKALATPPPVNPALLFRGRERYEIYCAPCHGLTGAGDGVIVRRGFPRPKSFDDPDQRQAPADRLLSAIGNGFGRMYSFSDRVEPADRWAIVAYIRALQLAGKGKATP